jgi:predicted nuclease of restriction endonuclease-like (RecB) superfamily
MSSLESHEILQPSTEALFSKVTNIIDSGREEASQAVYNAMTKSYFLIGKEIVEDELNGNDRAGYGKQQLQILSEKLTLRYGRGFSVRSLREIKRFYTEIQKRQTASAEFKPTLSYSHYLLLLDRDEPQKSFYEQYAIENKLTYKALKRVMQMSLYERALANQTLKSDQTEITPESTALTIFKQNPIVQDPIILDFLGLKENEAFLESELEKRIIDNIERFLLEMGRGFAFVGRQQAIAISGKYFHVDLVFYNFTLNCFVLIDLKKGLIDHRDIGQISMYVNYYDKEVKKDTDLPTFGIVLGSDKDNAVMKYAIGENSQIFASKYLTYLPTEEQLNELVQEAKTSILEKGSELIDEQF